MPVSEYPRYRIQGNKIICKPRNVLDAVDNYRPCGVELVSSRKKWRIEMRGSKKVNFFVAKTGFQEIDLSGANDLMAYINRAATGDSDDKWHLILNEAHDSTILIRTKLSFSVSFCEGVRTTLIVDSRQDFTISASNLLRCVILHANGDRFSCLLGRVNKTAFSRYAKEKREHAFYKAFEKRFTELDRKLIHFRQRYAGIDTDGHIQIKGDKLLLEKGIPTPLFVDMLLPREEV